MQKMNRMIPDTNLSLSPLALGCGIAGLKWNGADADRLFDAYLDMGGNVIDTARVYSDWIPSEVGRSERVIGEWIVRSKKRNQALILTKGGHPDMRCENVDMHKSRMSKSDMIYDLDLSLKTLHTDYIDIYFYHRDDRNQSVEELIDVMESFVKEGKIRYYGCSNWSTERMKEADEYCKRRGYRGFVANEALYNLGYAHAKPSADDTLCGIDLGMQAYHRDNPRNLAIPYTGFCGGFFNKYLLQGAEAVKDSQFYTPGNLEEAKRVEALTKKYNISITRAVMGFFTQQEFACVPLFAPRDIESLEDAMGTFEIPFEKVDYI